MRQTEWPSERAMQGEGPGFKSQLFPLTAVTLGLTFRPSQGSASQSVKWGQYHWLGSYELPCLAGSKQRQLLIL